jgi:hypothetical protein
MNEFPASDRRRPRRGDGLTSGSSHLELISGDFAIPPRPYVSITSMNRSIASAASRRKLGMYAAFTIAALLSTIIVRPVALSGEGDIEEQRFSRTCMQWHLAASAAVSRQVQSTRDVDLRQVSDSIFRMRRARRNCEVGWATLACQDYHSVAAGVPGYVMTNDLFPCARVAVVSGELN